MRRVVVTGLGLVTPLACGVSDTWARLLAGQSGAGKITRFDPLRVTTKYACEVPFGDGADGTFNPNDWMEQKERRKVDDFILYGVSAAEQAVTDAGWKPNNEKDLERTGVMIGSGIGGLNSIAETAVLIHEKGPRRVSPFFIPGALINLISGQVSIKYGFKGPNHSVVTACASGAHAIGDSFRMISQGDADVMISGITRSYKDSIRPALRVIGVEDGLNKIAGMYILISKDGPMFFADTTVNINPTVEEIVDITILVAKTVKQYKISPKIALLSYSNFGSNKGEDAIKMREATKILHEKHPGLIVDGEVQANFAVNKELINDFFPFSMLSGKSANTLIFPNLSSGNIAYKLVKEMNQQEAIGPILLGMKKPVHVLQIGSSVREILNMITLGVVDVQNRK